jgi:hypothetical protein
VLRWSFTALTTIELPLLSAWKKTFAAYCDRVEAA